MVFVFYTVKASESDPLIAFGQCFVRELFILKGQQASYSLLNKPVFESFLVIEINILYGLPEFIEINCIAEIVILNFLTAGI